MATYDKGIGSCGTGALRINVDIEQFPQYNMTRFWFSHQIVNNSSQTYSNGVGWSANAHTSGNSGSVNITKSTTHTLWSGYVDVGHDGNGNIGGVGFGMHMNATGTSCLGGANDHSVTIYANRIGQVPGNPGTPTITNVTPTGMTVSWTAPSRGHADTDQILLRRNTNSNPDASGYVDTVLSASALSTVVTGLSPTTTYYFKVYAHNSDGYSSGTATVSQMTLAADPPTMVVTASPSGTSVSVAVGPPGGASGVTKYTIENRPVGGASTSTDVTTPPLVINGLTPGSTYEYRSSAWFGTYQSPWTSWTSLTQPNPNTSPGDYFDGATTDKVTNGVTTTDYQWTGTANASTSVAKAPSVTGWTAGGFSNGAAGVLHQVAGGYAGQWSSRIQFTTDATAAGAINAGQDSATTYRSAVAVGGVYAAGIYVYPSRTQRMSASMILFNAAGSTVSTVAGTQTVCPGNTWTRLVVPPSLIPSNVETAVVRFGDVAGTSFSPWLSGEWVIMDAAMITLTDLVEYFDGDTPDTESYDYEWQGAPNASVSVRTRQDAAATGAGGAPVSVGGFTLVDPDCPAVPAPPRPPIVPSNCISDTGLWRRYWSYIPASSVEDWLTTIPTLKLVTGSKSERQVRIRYYADPFNRPSTSVNTDDYCSEQILSYIPASTTVTIDGVTERVFAEVQGGAPQSADHLLYGSNGTPADWPHLSCGIGYWVSLDVPSTSELGNLDAVPYLTTRV